MADISPINGSSYASRPPAPARSHAEEVEAPRRSVSDAVELSDRALLLARLKQLPAVREELVDRVRAEIDAGAYETPEKIEAVLDRLAIDLEA
jgi:negative regulator of flagellin synthesis FlgM